MVFFTAIALATGAAPAAARTTARLFDVPTGNAGVSGIVRGSDGAIWFAESEANRLGRISTDGKVTEFPIVATDDLDQPMIDPHELVASGNWLYVLMDFGHILRFDPADPTHPENFYDPPGWQWPDSLAAGPAGGVWYGDEVDEKVVRMTADGSESTYPADYDQSGPFVSGPGGSIWFASVTDSDTEYLHEVTAEGGSASIAVARPGLARIESIAFDRKGMAWFGKYDPGNWIVSPSGGTIGWVDGRAKAHQVQVGEKVLPHSLVLGPDGAIWFAAEKGVGRIAPGSHRVQRWSLAPYDVDEMTFGADDALWMTDSGANRIGRIGITRPPRISAPRQHLRKIAKSRAMRVRCTMSAAGRCTVTASIPARRARRLGLTRGGGAKPFTLAKGSKSFARSGSKVVKLKVPRRKALALRRVRRLTVDLTGVAQGPNALPATARARRSFS
ncbi:MAG: hypothetical protein J0H98_11380 [Solirubrobacterales bacterium]|nr:hypothetical protein [Solirubrobacterales bacterium]